MPLVSSPPPMSPAEENKNMFFEYKNGKPKPTLSNLNPTLIETLLETRDLLNRIEQNDTTCPILVHIAPCHNNPNTA